MRFWKSTRSVTISLACCGLLLPPSASAQEDVQADTSTASSVATPPRQRQVVDVQLDKQHTLVGEIVAADGAAVTRTPVQLWYRNQLRETLESDEQGAFRFQALRGGIYQIAIGNEVHVLRCWTAGSAPPHAAQTLRLTVGEETVRGQGFPATCGVASPWIIAGVAIAAIVIPIALHNNRSDRTASE